MIQEQSEGIAKYLENPQLAIRIYSNVRVKVQTGKIEISKLKYWRKNARTLLNVKRIEHETGQPIEELTDDNILDYLLKDPSLKLRDLANSIDKNGVRVPVTLTTDGRLIDGNRRLFACKILVREYMSKNETPPEHVMWIPADVLLPQPGEKEIEKLVIAEANFITDFKVDWPREVKAAVVEQEFHEAKSQGLSRDQAYAKIRRIYGIDAGTVDTFLEIVKFTSEFVRSVKKERRLEAQAIVKDCWNCFEDFVNKAKYSRGRITKPAKFRELRDTFFTYVFNGQIKAMPRVRDLIDCYKDPVAWEIVQKSGGLRLREAAAVARANLQIKSYSERVKQFDRWLGDRDIAQLHEVEVELKKLLKTVQKALRRLKH
jgi:hypothetical protein